MGYGDAGRLTFAPAITLSGSFAHGDNQLFAPVSLNLPASQWTCLLGASGAGKSTVLRLIAGLETGGTFSGDITASDNLPLEGRISYMAQSDLLLPWLSVEENVRLGPKLRGHAADDARATELIHRVGLTNHKHKKPAALSGGMRQRAALARTLMEDRPIVLLDEPFSALDAGNRADMQELAAEMLVEKTVLLVTHDPTEATRVGHQVIVLTHAKAEVWPVPAMDPLRDVHDPATLECQAALLAHLRQTHP